jgi:Penicillin binding protein transpeptidase domain
MHEVLVVGYDTPGAEAALVLRNALGSDRMLALLRELGLGVPPGKMSLDPKTDNVNWGETLSIGEVNVEVTLEQIARFLRKVGTSDSASSRQMRSALRDAVARGSASSVGARLEGSGWSLGGKTGTGPAGAAPDYDGCFAGLIFKGEKPRYAIAIYIQRRGKGGGAAAGIAADLVRWFASQEKGK